MPFTPFHLGPAFGLGLPLRKYLHAPTFVVASVIVDVEPFMVLVFGLRYPLHGYVHTFSLAFIVGLILGYVMFRLERVFRPLYRLLLFEAYQTMKLKTFMMAGVFGAMLHVLLDAPLYSDIPPFYPLTANPLYHPALSLYIYSLCVWLGIFGATYYVCLLAIMVYKRFVSN